MRPLLRVVVAVVCLNPPAPAQADEPALSGLWVAEFDFGPEVRGNLTVTRAGGSWRAEITGATASCADEGGVVSFAFPNGDGYRGEIAANGREIRGFWIQSAGEIRGQALATPVALVRAGRERWRGWVTPLDERLHVYLRIFRADDGELRAVFRNPELNLRGGASWFAVTLDGDTVVLSAGTGERKVRHEASFARHPDRLRMFLPDLGREIELIRATPEQAAGFFPRAPGDLPYVYGRPQEAEDGWRTARAREVGIDETALAQLVRSLIDSDPASQRPRLIHSILVARRGRLVLEEYFFGHDRDTPHDSRSASKTFSSVMLGAVMREGTALGPETSVFGVLEEMGPFQNPDPRKARITLAHLMTHTSGLACDDNDEDSPGNEGVMQTQQKSPDWWKYALDLPVTHEPGAHYAYCSAGMNLAGAVLTVGTRTWLPKLFHRSVAIPLGFGRYHWNLMPNGEGYLGGGVHLRPRDLLKVGQAYLDGGVWKGRRIVGREWVTRSTAPRVEFSSEIAIFSGADGYAWHRYGVRVGGRLVDSYEANGNGGQLLLVVPEFDLVVVLTGGNYMQGGIWGAWRDEVVGGVIIPAIVR